MRNKIVQIASNEVGYKEIEKNQTKYGEWFGMQDEWCNIFVSWCANQAGISEEIIPRTAYVPNTAIYYDRKGQYKNSIAFGGNYIPLPGDIVLFDYNTNTTSDHIGIVEKVIGKTLYVLEGNKNNMVQRCKYDLESRDIRAYCVPEYIVEEIIENKPTVVQPITVENVKIFNRPTVIYEKSNLTGEQYSYKSNTSVIVLENLGEVDKVEVRVTGRVGFVYNVGLYKDNVATKTVNAKIGLNVRNEPNINAKRVDGLANGEKVQVYEEKDGWTRIGNDRWVASQYLV